MLLSIIESDAGNGNLLDTITIDAIGTLASPAKKPPMPTSA